MNIEKRSKWRCQKCKTRTASTSSNNSYHIIVDNSPIPTLQQKQQREDDGEENSDTKRFKESLSLREINKSYSDLKSDVNLIKNNISGINTTMMELTNVIKNNTQTNADLQATLNSITGTLANINTQLKEMHESNKERDIQLNEMSNKINNIEQQLLNKNIEITNVTNENLKPNEIIKRIGSSVGIEITDGDISQSYQLKKSQKIIIEFNSINKKRELMKNIKRHRVESKIINDNNDENKYIYINEQLTMLKRRLLWQAKTKAKETNWQFVWVRNGYIYAKKNEISKPLLINNSSDIELITYAI